jgi:hypothetical protein
MSSEFSYSSSSFLTEILHEFLIFLQLQHPHVFDLRILTSLSEYYILGNSLLYTSLSSCYFTFLRFKYSTHHTACKHFWFTLLPQHERKKFNVGIWQQNLKC